MLQPTSPHRKIREGLQPVKLDIMNESHKHAGHSGNPTGTIHPIAIERVHAKS